MTPHLPSVPVPTSEAAAQAALPRAGTARRLVLDAIDGSGPRGLTDEQLAHRVAGRMAANGVRARRVELARIGLIVTARHTRETASGCQAVVWLARRWAVGQMELCR